MASALWFVHLGLVMSTGSGLTTGDLSARRHVKRNKKISWDIFPSWLFGSFFFVVVVHFFLPSYPDDIFWFFLVYLFIPRELGRFVGIWLAYACVSTLLSPAPLPLYFLVFWDIFFFSFRRISATCQHLFALPVKRSHSMLIMCVHALPLGIAFLLQQQQQQQIGWERKVQLVLVCNWRFEKRTFDFTPKGRKSRNEICRSPLTMAASKYRVLLFC